MTAYVALLRGVNIGGRKLVMRDLQSIAGALGLEQARTYIASGNLLFTSRLAEADLKRMIEPRLAAHLGSAVPVMIRSAAELGRVVRGNPFPAEPGNRVAVIFLDEAPPANTAESARNLCDERIGLGEREVYVAYGEQGMGQSRLRIPAAEAGTARNMNTVARLAELAREMS